MCAMKRSGKEWLVKMKRKIVWLLIGLLLTGCQGSSALTPEERAIQDYMDQMTIAEKVGQMFMVRCPNTKNIEAIEQYQMGGFILFDSMSAPYDAQTFKKHNEAFQAVSKTPMLIGVDEEGGSVNRLSTHRAYREEPFLSPQDLYKQGGFARITSDTQEKDAFLKALGVNVNFAPISDVSTEPTDFINSRSFGKDAAQTSTYVETVVTQMGKDQVGSVLKHFPGYGNNSDTHTGSSLDKRSLESFRTNDFLPFEAGIKAGADSILVSHNVITCLDEYHPASLSKEVHEVLREELQFSGVILTDDLYMKAIRTYTDDKDAAVQAVLAGNDMLIITNYQVQIPAVIEAVEKDVISEKQIDASVERILKWKVKLGVLSLTME